MSGTRTFFVVICCLTVIPKPNLADPLPGMLFPRESESRELKDLNGLWNFRVDSSKTRDAGFQEKWYSKPLEKSGRVIPMPVPASYNDITQEKSIRDFIGWAWYDMDTYVPQRWKDNSTRVVLRFESAHYYILFFSLGAKADQHSASARPAVGCSAVRVPQTRIKCTLSFSCTPTPSTHLILTRKCLNNAHPTPPTPLTSHYASRQHAHPLHTYPTTPSPIATTRSQPPKPLGVKDAVLCEERGTGITLQLDINECENNPCVNGGTCADQVNSFSCTCYCSIVIHNRCLPMQISTSSTQSSLQDVYRLPVGIRTVRVEGTKFLINNREFYFKGFGKHEDANIRGKGLDNVLIAKDFNLMKWLGGNSFRTSHYPYAEEIMDMADRTGIVVIDESPGVGIHYSDNFGPVSLKHHQEVMAELVRRDKNRPAVVMWSVANEPLSNLAQAEKYFAPIFSETRKLDPTRPVTFVTNFKAWSDKVVQFVDVILCNRYYAWYHDFGQTQLISRQLEEELMDWYKTFKKPVVQAEYGADTLAGLHSDPALMFTEEYQIESIDQYFPVFDKLRKEFLVGEMIWNFADFMTQQGVTRVVGNKKGILTRERQPKAAAFVLRQRYLNITLEQSPTSTGDELLDALVKFESRTPTTGNQ
ncbi:predicted protein [Nematostella vectensis]|uniref:EGF-like domain-containing protein n=1 Tax=Nematostella vectensis TaxID=45351 RepID=A7RVA9_NEMVE|nr:predicted protein [Nematostella vectensis]|eukprot:XP_001636675.1 predicted protein [Nematostella vectensis]